MSLFKRTEEYWSKELGLPIKTSSFVKESIPKEYDVIIIGAGHNGLTAAAYLAKAGAKVLVLEKRFETGGAVFTEDFDSPCRYNVHATYMMMAELMPIHQDFPELARNVSYIRPEVQDAFIYEDGKALVFYTDLDKTLKSIEKISKEDVPAFRKMYEEVKALFEEIILPQTYVPPTPILDLAVALQKTPLGKRLLEISEFSPRELVESYGFKDPRLNAAILYLATMWIIDPDAKGIGYLVPLYIYRMMNAALVRGGTHALSSALQEAVTSYGGIILENALVEKIIVENSVAKGVKLSTGEEFYAKAVISTLNPRQTFLELIDRSQVPEDLAMSAEKWRFEEWSLFTSHYMIKPEPLKYKAAKFDEDVNKALLVVIGYESPDDVLRHIEEVKKGRLPDKVAGHVTCTTQFDPLQGAPSLIDPYTRKPTPPLHVLRWECWAPYELNGRAENWDKAKFDYARRCYEEIMKYVANADKIRVLETYAETPLDTERRFRTMERGGIKHGAYIAFQMGIYRPNTLCSRYRTPIKGLYVGGASTYPGGMVLAGPGYNVANVVAEDLGLKKWWRPPEYIVRAREKGYVL
jgi:phytoene dehydrogenase-like protein